MYTIKEMIELTNTMLKDWYLTAKKDYNITGNGECFYDATENEIKVIYRENGEEKTWSMAYYPEYTRYQKINWVFNCWSELA